MAPDSHRGTSGVPAQVDWLPRIDVLLAARAEQVWPLVLHWERWITDYRVEHVSGPRDQAGEVKRVSQVTEDGTVTGSFYVEVVRFEVNQRLAYRFLPLKEPAFGADHIAGYEIFNLVEIGTNTLLTYETVAQLETAQSSQEQFSETWRGAQAAGARAWAERYIPELKKLLGHG